MMKTVLKHLAMFGLLGLGACGDRYESLQLQRVASDEAAHGSDDGFLVREGRAIVFEVSRYEHMGQAGLGVAGLGAAVLLTITAPSYVLYKRAMDNAAGDEFVVDRDDTLRKARLRRNFMHGSMAAGAGLAVTGIVVAIAGYRRRSVLSRQRAALTLAPQLGPGQLGAVAMVRF